MNKTQARLLSIIVASLALPIVGCARPSTVVITEPIGSSPAIAATNASQGVLVVFTETFANPDPSQAILEHGDGRLGYEVRDAQSGALITKVASGAPETPAVKLAPGHYRVRADRLSGSQVEATVSIQAGRTTEIYLDRSHPLPVSELRGLSVVAPDGSFVGWRGTSG